MGTQERLNAINRLTLTAILQMMRVLVNHRKGQKHLKKKCFISKEYLGQVIYLWPIVTHKPLDCSFGQSSSLSLFVPPEKTFWKNRHRLRNLILTIFVEKKHGKETLTVGASIRNLFNTNFSNCSSMQMICITLKHAECAKLQMMQKKFEKFNFFSKIFRQKNVKRIEKLSTGD